MGGDDHLLFDGSQARLNSRSKKWLLNKKDIVENRISTNYNFTSTVPHASKNNSRNLRISEAKVRFLTPVTYHRVVLMRRMSVKRGAVRRSYYAETCGIWSPSRDVGVSLYYKHS
ncbi:hypothetical protein EVAR_6955_1 [Eumeta japonica]|uniref:Uncharacterized protein n=1 Tax=Eumeta variegata TaxID=151549 RepID=A0A4C1TJK0_EUMVA|nr:hypothetical protein EVAR_6955_1 [Eumeta japonica]